MLMSEEVEKQIEEWDPENLRNKTRKLKVPIEFKFDIVEGEIRLDNVEISEPERKKVVPKSVVKKKVGKKSKDSNKLF